MNWLEFLLAVLVNIKGFFEGGLVFSSIICIGSGVMWVMTVEDEYHRDENKRFSFVFKYSAWIFVVCGIIASIPDVEDLWKTRIGLIKLQLASPQNIQTGVETIERIGKKLECKYVGCEETKK